MAFRGVVAVAVLLLAGVSDCLELGKPMPGVTELTSKNYKKSVTDGRNWLIEFYAPWCSWCKKLAPEWKLLGQSVKGSKEVAAGKVNVDSDVSDIVDKYNIKGYPTIILVRPDGKWKKYSGTRTAAEFLSFIKEETQVELGVKVNDEDKMTGGTGVVQVITTKNFQPLVLDPTLNAYIKFYAPWCSHCKAMEDDWKQLAVEVKDRKDVVIAEVDAEKYRDVGDKAKVGSFPTVKLFTKKNKRGLEFKGPRTIRAFKNFLESNI